MDEEDEKEFGALTELDRAEEKWATVFETVPVGVVISDAATGRIHAMNERCEEISGYTIDEMVGRTSLELGMWEDPERREEVVRWVREDGVVEGEEAWFRSADGDRKYLWIACRRLELAGEDRLLWALQDVTGERERRERLHLLESAVRATDHGVLMTDRQGTIVWANSAFSRMTGYELKEVIGETPSLLKSGEQDEAFYEELWQTILSGETWSGEMVNRRKDGTHYVVAQSIVPIRHRSEAITHFVAVNQDVTKEKSSAQRFRTLFEESPALIAITTPGGDLVEANGAFLELFGYERDELSALEVGQLYADPADRDRFLEAVRREGEVIEFEADLCTKTGEIRICEISTTLIEVSEGEEDHLQAIIRDITDRKRMEDQLRYQALHDSLTGLPNRSLLADRVEQGVARARRHGFPLGLVMLDIDHFKRVNDRLGHAAGDRVLVEVARRLQGAVREEDTVARWGGDEFFLVLPDLETQVTIPEVHTRVREAIRLPIEAAGESVQLEVTGGAVVYGDAEHGRVVQTGNPDELIRFASLALHLAKDDSPAGFCVFDPEAEVEGAVHIRRERRLRRALEEGRIVPYYQPIVRLEDGSRVMVEALARWEHPERGLVPPGEFIPLAEELGLIGELDEAVLRRGCRQAADWEDWAGDSPLRLAFNLSGQQFNTPGLDERLERWVTEAGLDPERVILELTETSLVQVPGTIEAIRERGFSVYVDDFGTGYSTFAYLRDLDLDGIKIDLSFVQRITTSSSDMALVETMITLGDRLGLEVVAEGVETEAQRRMLLEFVCELGQGFLFDRPMTGEELVAGGVG